MGSAFQQTISNQSLGQAQQGAMNANSLINPGAGLKGLQKGNLSFAQEFARLQALAGSERDEMQAFADASLDEQPVVDNTAKKHLHNNFTALINQASGTEAEMKLKSLRDEDTIREIKKTHEAEEGIKDAEEVSSKYQTNETVKASVSQENQKAIVNAVREGNVAQQESQNQNDGNERKRQLANWEDLAPRVTEDTVNRAVRIDIPGLNDIETIIVRMKRDAVSMQVVGSKDAMERLHLNQAELVRNLKDKNVKMASLQVFDGDIVRKKMNEKAGRGN